MDHYIPWFARMQLFLPQDRTFRDGTVVLGMWVKGRVLHSPVDRMSFRSRIRYGRSIDQSQRIRYIRGEYRVIHSMFYHGGVPT